MVDNIAAVNHLHVVQDIIQFAYKQFIPTVCPLGYAVNSTVVVDPTGCPRAFESLSVTVTV